MCCTNVFNTIHSQTEPNSKLLQKYYSGAGTKLAAELKFVFQWNLYPVCSYHLYHSASLQCTVLFSSTKNSQSTIRAHSETGCDQLAYLQLQSSLRHRSTFIVYFVSCHCGVLPRIIPVCGRYSLCVYIPYGSKEKDQSRFLTAEVHGFPISMSV